MFSNVPLQRVISMHDRESIYTIPEAMRAQGLDREILTILDCHSRVNTVHEDAQGQLEIVLGTTDGPSPA